MRKDWEYKKLGDIAENKLSYGSGASAIPFDNKTRYIRITDIDDSGNLKDNIVSPNVVEDKYLLSDGDILFARSGATVGKTFLYKEEYGECIYAGYLIRLVPNQQLVLPEYVYYYTQSHYYKSFVESNKKVVAQPNINAQQYTALRIPLPPKPTQLAIVAELDKLNEMIRLKKQQLEDYDQLAQSIFYEMFGDPVENEKGWEVKKLGEVTIYPNERISIEDIQSNQYIGVENLLKDKAGVSFSNQLPNATSAIHFSYNDILLGNIRPYLKKIWLSDIMGGASADVIVIRTSSNKVLPMYLFKLLSTNTFFDYDNLNTKGAKMPRGDKKAIAKFPVPLPPLPLQQQFAARIEAIEQQKQQVKDTIKDLETLLASRMQYWFD